MDFRIANRVAMVAAASKGLGLATAQSLAREGCRLSICSRSEEALEEAKRAIGGDVLAVACDVSKPGDLQRWVDATRERFGAIDILVTNTGGPPAAKFLALSEEQWREGIDGVLMNVVRVCRMVIPEMQQRKWGRIVHITSLVAKQPMEILTISSTLRAGLSALTKTMAEQLAPDNILVNAVLPGQIATDRQIVLNEARAKDQGVSYDDFVSRVTQTIPLRRLGRPEEIGDVIAFLCSAPASYLTGVSLQVDGGLIKSTF
jgi:3-oxoacyl-[acyl-carrier protein] reductase